MASIYDFKIEGLTGEEINFAEFAGKKIMIVNVASECGNTPQYQQLQDLYNYYEGQLIIVGFPCNDFGRQEPGNEEEIKTFCKRNFGVSFPITKKVNIQSDPHPVYRWLCDKKLNSVLDSEVSWNFQKFLINEDGCLEKVISPGTEPASEEILSWLES